MMWLCATQYIPPQQALELECSLGSAGHFKVLLTWHCVVQYIPPEQARELEDMLAHDGGAATIKIGYRPYDWSVNTLDE